MGGMVNLVITVAASPRLTVGGIVYPSCPVITFTKSSNHSSSAVSMSIAWGWYVPAEGFSRRNVSLGFGEHMVFKRKGSPFAGSPFHEVRSVVA